MIAEAVFVVFFCLVTRLVFFSVQDSDYDVHLWHIKFYEKHGRLSRRHVDNGLFPGAIGNPPLPHFVYSRLPEAWRIPMAVLCNLLFDALAAVLVYALLRLELPANDPVPGLPLSLAATGALLYATTPLLHPLTSRLMGIGSRTLGNLLATAYFALLYYYLQSDGLGLPLLLGLWVLASLVVLSSKFALQALVFTSTALSLVMLDVRPFALTALSILALAALPGLNVRSYLRTRLNHAEWYLAAIKHPRMSQQLTTEFRGNWRMLKDLPGILRRDPNYGLWIVLRHVTPIIVVLSLPALVLVAWRMATHGLGPWAGQPFFGYCLAMTAAGLTMTALTSLRPLIVFGEAERYLEAVLPFVYFLLLAVCLESDPGLLSLLLLINLSLVLLNLAYCSKNQIFAKLRPKENKDFSELLDFLGTLEDGRSIVTTPHKLAISIDTFTERGFRYYFHLHADNGLGNIFRYYHNYFMFNLDFETIKRELGADTFIMHRSYLKRYETANLAGRLDAARLAFENGSYRVYTF